MTGVLTKRGTCGHRHERHGEECHVRMECHLRMEAGIVVIHLHVKGHQRLSATTRDRREARNRLPQGLQQKPAIRHLDFEFLVSRTVSVPVLSHPVCGNLPWQPWDRWTALSWEHGQGLVLCVPMQQLTCHLYALPCGLCPSPLGQKGQGVNLAGLAASTKAGTQA